MLNKKEVKIIEKAIKKCKDSKEHNIEQEEVCAIEKLLKSYNNARERNRKLKTRCKYIRDEGKLEGFIDGHQESEQEYKSELEKKDKIIDELEYTFDNYQLCEYEITDCTYRKCEYIADDEKPPCRECIKQYFEREVEDVK